MGKINSKAIQMLAITPDWKFEAANVRTRIFKNQKGIIAEEFFLNITSNQELERNLQIYSVRKNDHDTLIKVYGAEVIGEDSYFCSMEKKLRVFIQYLPKKLSSIGPMGTNVLTYTLFQILKGFREIYANFGRIKVNENLIAVSNTGVIKVWVNTNFALNHPYQFAVANNYSKDEEVKMVKDILNVVRPHCKGGNFPLALLNYFNHSEVLDFDSILLAVERYSEDITPKQPTLIKDMTSGGSIIDKLISVAQIKNKPSKPSQNTIRKPLHRDIYPSLSNSISDLSIKKIVSGDLYFSNLSLQIDERIKDNILTTNNRQEIHSPSPNRFASIPLTRPYKGK